MSQQTDAVARSAGTTGSESDRSGGESPTDSTVTVESVESRDAEWGVIVAVLLAGTGLVVGSPVLLAAATMPLWYVAAASLTGRPEAEFSVTRSLRLDGESRSGMTPGNSPDSESGSGGMSGEQLSGEPGDVVSVRTTVRNDGSEPAIDLRVVDGVPEALPVVEGSPRACVTLGPGEETTIEYGVELQRGEHAFTATDLQVRDLPGVTRVDVAVRATGAEALRCSPAVEQPPIGGGRNDYAGEVPTSEGGSGVEFHSVRDYEPGDPARSIDWRRYANTRDLATVEYRAERSTRILCVVDARESQFRAPAGSTLSTVELCADAAERTVGRLLQEGHPTGTAAVYSGEITLVPPGTGSAVRERATDLLGTVTDGTRLSGTVVRRLWDDPATALPQALDGETQVLLFSSFVDDEPLDLVERLRSRGYAVHVVSPDVTGGLDGERAGAPLDSLSVRLAGLDRENRLARARATGATVVKWGLDRSLGLVLDRAVREVGR